MSVNQQILALGVLLLMVGAAGATQDRVEALQQPTWVVSGGERSAAFPGQTLEPRDRIETGGKGKIWLRLAEGSRVKLGTDAVLEMDVQGMTRATAVADRQSGQGSGESGGLYEAALDVLKGAFRFTTTQLSQGFEREVDIQAGPVATVGIRGTDVWGRARADSSFVALIEGNISITRQDGTVTTLREPLTVFEASTDNPSGSTQKVDMAAVKKLAPETELDEGEGVLTRDGQWAVHLMSLQSRSAARQQEQALTRQGYAVKTGQAGVEGNTWYRLTVAGFKDAADARAFRQQAQARGLARTPWVQRQAR